MDNFTEEQIQDLLDSGFTNENIIFFQTLELNYQELYDNIMNLLDQGYDPQEIIQEIVRQQDEENEDYASGRTSIETLNAEMNGGKRKRKRKSQKTKQGPNAHKSKKRRKTLKTRKNKNRRKSR